MRRKGNRSRERQNDTSSTKLTEITQVKTAIMNVFMNMRGKFSTSVSVNNCT